MSTHPLAADLTRHMSQELQSSYMLHINRAIGMLEPGDLLMMMMQAPLELSCAALSSTVATMAASTDDRFDPRTTLTEFIEANSRFLIGQIDTMLAKIEPAVAARRARG